MKNNEKQKNKSSMQMKKTIRLANGTCEGSIFLLISKNKKR